MLKLNIALNINKNNIHVINIIIKIMIVKIKIIKIINIIIMKIIMKIRVKMRMRMRMRMKIMMKIIIKMIKMKIKMKIKNKRCNYESVSLYTRDPLGLIVIVNAPVMLISIVQDLTSSNCSFSIIQVLAIEGLLLEFM